MLRISRKTGVLSIWILIGKSWFSGSLEKLWMRLNLTVYHPHKSNRNRLINGKQIIDFYLYYQSGQLYRTFSGDVRAGHMLLVGRFRRIGQHGIQYLSWKNNRDNRLPLVDNNRFQSSVSAIKEENRCRPLVVCSKIPISTPLIRREPRVYSKYSWIIINYVAKYWYENKICSIYKWFNAPP